MADRPSEEEPTSIPARRPWTESTLTKALESEHGTEVAGAAKALLTWAHSRGLSLVFGSGPQLGGVFVDHHDAAGTRHRLFSIWTTGKLNVEFGHLRLSPPFDSRDARLTLLVELNTIPGVALDTARPDTYRPMSLAALADADARQRFTEIVSKVVEDLKARRTRYWAWRHWPDFRAFVFAELHAGRLRQGWGSEPDQDLTVIEHRVREGEPLSEAQQDTWRGNRPLLGREPTDVHVGDLIFLPRLPDHGSFVLARVTGAYRYEIADLPGGVRDLGHILPADLVAGPLPMETPPMSQSLRGVMGNRTRMWSLDRFGEELETLAGLRDGLSGADLAEESYRIARALDPRRQGVHYDAIKTELLREGTRIAGAHSSVSLAGALREQPDLFEELSDGVWRWR